MRAISPGAAPSKPSQPRLTPLGSSPAAPDARSGTGPGTEAVLRGRPCQRAIRFHLSRKRPRLPERFAGRDQNQEHPHVTGQGSRGIRGKVIIVLGKARAEDRGRETVRQKEHEQDLDEERRRQRELDRDLGWEL